MEKLELEKRLAEEFKDTLDSGNSQACISISFFEASGLHTERSIHTVTGFPYTIENHNLIIGPYMKRESEAPPSDYDARKMSIPISNIVWYRRANITK